MINTNKISLIILIALFLPFSAFTQHKVNYDDANTYPYDFYRTYSAGLKDSIFTGINDFMLQHPDSIYKLIINYNDNPEIISLPVELYKFRNLEELYIEHTNLSTLSDSLLQLKNLKSLVLFNNKFNKVPSVILKMWQLEVLNLTGFGLNSLPDSLSNLVNLKIITLNRNHFKTIPPQILKLANLHSLGMAHNEIDIIPTGIKCLKKLNELGIDENPLYKLPKEMEHLKHLLYLGISFTYVEHLPDGMYKLKGLHLNLSGDKMDEKYKEIERKAKGKNWKISAYL